MTRLMDFLASLGLVVRWNDPRTAGHIHSRQQSGPEVDGFTLSLEATDATLFVALQNHGSAERPAEIPDWLIFYQVSIKAPNGQPARLKDYGRQLLESHRAAPLRKVSFPAGQSVDAEIPLAPLYYLPPPGPYRVTVSCPVPGSESRGVLVSNEVLIR